MKSKHWLLLYFLLLFAGILGYMGLNYYANPLGYFTVKKGMSYYRADDYTRAIKSEYLLKNSDQYDAVIIGGSKAGVLSTDRLTEYTGKRYYNFFNNIGNFSDYLRYTEFILNHTDISEITLHLSSYEVQAYSQETRSSNFEVPAIVAGNKWDQLTETLGYLMTDLKTVIEELKTNPDEKGGSPEQLVNGERNRNNSFRSFEKNPRAYIKKEVTKGLKKYLKQMFAQKANSQPAYDDNIAALRQIKALCDEHNVTLKVVIGAGFLGERNIYECERYYDYLAQIVTITDVWDFNDFHPINLNPYNFLNRKHYTNTVADLMIDTMYGKDSVEGFGHYLTRDNIYDYLKARRADFKRLKEEFEATGTIALPGMDDESYIPYPKPSQ